jgi:uncharacterized metal-binding protein
VDSDAGRYAEIWAPYHRVERTHVDRHEAIQGFGLRLVVFSVLLVSTYFVSSPVLDLSARLSLDLERVVQRPAP